MAPDEEIEDTLYSLPPETVYMMGRKSGLKEGVRRFAWWKDGTQYVGTTGKTLKKALEEIDAEFA